MSVRPPRAGVSRRLAIAMTVAIALSISVLPAPPAVASSDTAVRWDNFSEASACGEPYTQTPYVSRAGFLSESEAILGPFGSYFGRTISRVRSQLAYWTVPYSGGLRVQVHKAALPAFQEVAKALAAEAAAGRVYRVTNVGAFTPRTINTSRQLSRHALGTAIDINPVQNPYRADGKLITNMPAWYLNVWRAQGFCWGGDWVNAKDPMHFSWMGPRSTPNPTDAITPSSPLTALRDFGPSAGTLVTAFAPILDRYVFSIADGTGDGAPDVVGLRSHPDGAVIDIATGSGRFDSCSIGRWFVPDTAVASADRVLFADIDGDSRQDLMALTASGGSMQVTTATRRGSYDDLSTTTTGVPSDSAAVAAADYDGDHVADLWAVGPDGTLEVFGGESWGTILHTSAFPGGPPEQMAVADRDGGDTPEIFALYDTGAGARIDELSLGSSWTVDQAFSTGVEVTSLGAIDYDGDGRADLETMGPGGALTVFLGNSPTGPAGRSAGSWFYNPKHECEPDSIKLVFEGSFFDDEGSVHTKGIEALAASGITQSCNPPFKDRFCPAETLSRAQAATFMARALDLPPTEVDHFRDDDGHILEGGINRLAEAGITVGCNPPANDRFCPERALTRAEFAAFLARGLDLGEATSDFFTDDNGHVLEGAVNRLAQAGITTGCNPPDNTQFCPDRILNRAETATFLTRALDLP